MLVAISATGPSVRDEVDSHFGRCPYFIIVDFDTMKVESLPNPNAKASGGAGISTAQMIANKGVQTILTGNCGPKAFEVLEAADVKVVTGVRGKIRDIIRGYKPGHFQPDYQPSVESHFGMGRGMGRGMGAGAVPPSAPAPQPATPKQELEELKAQSQKLAQQLAEIQRRIEEAGKKEE